MELEFFSASLINLAINLCYSIIAIVVSVYALFWLIELQNTPPITLEATGKK